MQYLPPSHQILDLDSSHSFVESSWSVFRNGLLYILHHGGVAILFLFRNKRAKIQSHSTQVYWNMNSFYCERNAEAWNGGCIFLSQSSYGSFCHPLTQNNNSMFLRDFLWEDCVPCKCFSQNCMYSKELSGICRLPSHLASLWGHEGHLEPRSSSVWETEIIVHYVY